MRSMRLRSDSASPSLFRRPSHQNRSEACAPSPSWRALFLAALSVLLLVLLSVAGCGLLGSDPTDDDSSFEIEVLFRADGQLDPWLAKPIVSADGKYVIVVENAATNFEHVVLIATDGSGVVRRLTSDYNDYAKTGFSPDGRYAFYQFGTGDLNGEGLPLSDIMVVDLETGEQRRLGRPDRLEGPRMISPDGRYLLGSEWMGFGIGGQTRVWDLTQAEPVGVAPGGLALYGARFSPDGQAIYAFDEISGMRNLLRVDLETGDVRTIVDEEQQQLDIELRDITDDGHEELLVNVPLDLNNGPEGIALLDIETGTRQHLTTNPADVAWQLSPDERYVTMYESTGEGFCGRCSFDHAYLISIDGSKRYELPKDTSPLTFLPDGRVLLLHLNDDKDHELWAARLRPTTP